MTETDELVAMLNERGVEHDETFEDGVDYIWWSDGERDLFAHSYHGGLAVYGLSARHAITATLGRGTCEMEYVNDWMGWHCKSCDNLRQGLPDQKPKYCPNCGARVVSQ